MKLPDSFTKVTPLSKLLAGILFILLPFIGFYAGLKYQPNKAQDLEFIPKETIVKVPQEDNQNSLIRRCGDIPVNAYPEEKHFDAVTGPMWAPDCRHIAWSLWESGTGYGGNDPKMIEQIENNPRILSGREGIFLYNDSDRTIKKIYNPTKLSEGPTLIKWEDRDILIFEADQKEYTYGLISGETSLVNK